MFDTVPGLGRVRDRRAPRCMWKPVKLRLLGLGGKHPHLLGYLIASVFSIPKGIRVQNTHLHIVVMTNTNACKGCHCGSF